MRWNPSGGTWIRKRRMNSSASSGTLLQKRLKAHHFLGHRRVLGSVEGVQPKPYWRPVMTTAPRDTTGDQRLARRYGLRSAASRSHRKPPPGRASDGLRGVRGAAARSVARRCRHNLAPYVRADAASESDG